MFITLGEPSRRGVGRRQFLTAGALGLGGLTLAGLLRAEAAAGVAGSAKSVILIHLDGGPPHLDTIDLKPDAPVEVRGEFRPIASRAPGLRLCELMPKVAEVAGRFAFLRTVVGSAGAHDAFQCQSGFPADDLKSVGGRPALGAVVAKLRAAPDDAVPSFVDLMQGRPQVRNSARPGFLGPGYAPFRPDISQLFPRELEPAMKQELAARGGGRALRLTLVDGVTPERLSDRARLVAGFDRARRDLDASGDMDAMDRFTRQAAGILTSGRLAEAMDLTKEPAAMLERYTAPASAAGERFYTSEDHAAPRKLLLARRLVEAGVRCVSVSFSDFDTHSGNFPRMRQLLPILDHGLHALVTDLADRGLLGDVVVVAAGEFGRTPKVNKDGGRDHWPQVSPALLAGGGLRTGQVIGATDRLGEEAASRPVRFQDVFATLYRTLGIDPATVLADPDGRPQRLVDRGEPIRELI